ncbi:hypothetical protein EF905_33725 [Streptomyces sp. WAC05374]|nr:hypothetical protein EF905_33725 [Streptomyces sp. WAC05374]
MPEAAPQLPANHESPWFAAAHLPQDTPARPYAPAHTEGPEPAPAHIPPGPGTDDEPLPAGPAGPHAEDFGPSAPDPADPDAEEFGRLAYPVFKQYVDENNDWPSVDVLDIHLADGYGIRHPLSAVLLRRLLPEYKNRYQAELAAEHIA